MDMIEPIINIKPIDNNDGTFTVKLSFAELREITNGLTLMEKQRETARKYYEKTRKNKSTEFKSTRNKPPVKLQPIMDNDYTCMLKISSYDLHEINTGLEYVERRRNESRKNLHKKYPERQTCAKKSLILKIAAP